MAESDFRHAILTECLSRLCTWVHRFIGGPEGSVHPGHRVFAVGVPRYNRRAGLPVQRAADDRGVVRLVQEGYREVWVNLP